MPCLVALIALSILGIFSASHRKLAREAFACVFRRVTLRPCDTGFDTKVKAMVLGKLINRSPKMAKFISRRFEILAWVFVLVLTATSLWTMKGIYNFWAWGDCNGQYASGGFCAFDPTGENSKASVVDSGCVDTKLAAHNLKLEPIQLINYPHTFTPGMKATPIPGVDQNQVVFIGCYTCDYTRKAYPIVKELVQQTRTDLLFIHFPTKPETKYLMAYDVCVYNDDPARYWQLTDWLMAAPEETVADEAAVKTKLAELGINEAELTACIVDPATQKLVEDHYREIKLTGLYGTPTVFINGTAVVGPKPARVYKRLLKG